MQYITDLEPLSLPRPSIVTLGVFDGVHRGHQYLIRQLVEAAHQADKLAVIVSFYPHPDTVIRGITGRYYLTSLEEKARLIRELGSDVLVIHPFNDEVRNIRAAAFVDRLVKHLNMSSLWATADFALGYKREGNIPFLQAEGQVKGFEVVTIDPLLEGSSSAQISSSDIRAALTEGRQADANDWLGRPYRVTGEVVHGEKRGRQLGFPTANVDAPADQVLPSNGIYACYAILGDERFLAATSIGERPTFDGKGITVEAYLLDFDRDIYGQTLTLEFVERLRAEEKFTSIEALIEQMHRDVAQTRELLQDGAR